MTDATQTQEPTAPPVDAPPPETPPAEEPAQSNGEAPSDGRQPKTSAYAALRPELSAQGRRGKAATDALGLSRDASEQDIADAISALKSRPAMIDPGVELPPEIVQERQRLSDRAWQSAERDFGEDFALQAQGLQELVFNTDDPYELTSALHELAQSVGVPGEQPAPQNGAPPAGEQPPAPAPAQQQPGVDMEVGKPGWKVQADEADEKGSGDTRGFFQKVLGQKPQ